MKILLLMPDILGKFLRPVHPPVGLGYLATYLSTHGHEVKCADLRVKKVDLAETVRTFAPDWIGVSALSAHYLAIYDLVKRLKGCSDAPVVMGGAHVGVMRHKVLEDCLVDYAICGDGEQSLLELVEGKEDLSRIGGLLWRDGGRIVVNPWEPLKNLDELPFPAYDRFFDLKDYADWTKIPITTARGCPYACTYCAVRVINNGRQFRMRSPENVVGEMEHWYSRGWDHFGINDDTFTQSMKRAHAICDLIIGKGMRIHWDLRTGIRVDRIDEPLARKMRQAGCYFIAFGVESGVQQILDNINKGVKVEDVSKAVDVANSAGIHTSGFFMIGLPGETKETFRQTLEFARSLNLNEVRMYNTEPYPATELYTWVEQEGRFLAPMEEYLNSYSRLEEEPVFETEDFTREDRIEAFNEGEELMLRALLRKILHPLPWQVLLPVLHFKIVRKAMWYVGTHFSKVFLRITKVKEYLRLRRHRRWTDNHAKT